MPISHYSYQQTSRQLIILHPRTHTHTPHKKIFFILYTILLKIDSTLLIYIFSIWKLVHHILTIITKLQNSTKSLYHSLLAAPIFLSNKISTHTQHPAGNDNQSFFILYIILLQIDSTLSYLRPLQANNTSPP